MIFYIAQGVGVIGLCLAIISFQKNTNKGILLFQIMASLTFTIHFILLGAYTGAVMNFFGAARNTIFFSREKGWANNKNWMYLFIVIYIIAGIITYKNNYSLLPMAAMILSTVGLWVKTPKYTRLIMLTASPCWLIYNIVNASVAGILTELFALSSLLTAMVRFDYFQIKKQGEI